MRCPDCEDELRTVARLRVELAWCPKCRGAWLGRRDLDKLFERLHDDGGAREAPATRGDPGEGEWLLKLRFYDFG
jgi:Zn-finger nucleic acid-binding protein